METAFLAEHYRELDDDSLLRIAADRKDLTPEAAMVLDSELSARRLGHTDIQQLAAADRRIQRRQDRPNANYAGRTTLTSFSGHWNVEKRLGAEIYTATKFGPFLIPLGTYRLIRPRDYRRFFVLPRIVQKLPMDWRQVLWIWCRSLLVFCGILLLLIWHHRIGIG